MSDGIQQRSWAVEVQLSSGTQKKKKSMPSVMVHAFNPGFLETDAGGSLSEFLTT